MGGTAQLVTGLQAVPSDRPVSVGDFALGVRRVRLRNLGSMTVWFGPSDAVVHRGTCLRPGDTTGVFESVETLYVIAQPPALEAQVGYINGVRTVVPRVAGYVGWLIEHEA